MMLYFRVTSDDKDAVVHRDEAEASPEDAA